MASIPVLSPDQPFADGAPVRLGVWASDNDNFHFLDPILERLPARYEVRKFAWTPRTPSLQMHAQLGQVDMAWFEWGTGPVLPGSRLTKDKPAVCRIHRYEVYSGAPAQIEWRNVDRLVFISPQVARSYQELIGALPPVRVDVIPNAIPVDAFPFDPARARTFNLAFLGRLHVIKNPMMLVQILKKVVDRDPRFQLHVAGAVQHVEVAQYLLYHAEQLGLNDHLHFYGNVDRADIPAFLSQCSYLLSTSVIEGHPVGVMEAMAAGLKPIVHDYLGARDLFDADFLFNTIDEAAEMIVDGAYEPARYRRFVAERYDLDRQMGAYVHLLDGLVRQYYPHKLAAGPAVAV